MRKHRWKICLIMLVVLGFGGYLYAQDQITLTTYYPAPYGHYAHLEVEAVAGVGDGLAILESVEADTLEAGNNGGTWVITTNGSQLDIRGDIHVLAAHPGGSGTAHPIADLDIAEYFAVADAEATDVVVIHTEQDATVTRATKAFDYRVAGVISEDPVFHIGERDGWMPLALAGRVRVKATASNGPIARGDLLVTSDVPGHVMRAAPDHITPGVLVGKSLETLSEGEGLVLILVQSR